MPNSAIAAVSVRDASASTVVAAGGGPNLVIRDFEHEPVFIRDAARPVTGEVVLQWFGLADASIAVAADGLLVGEPHHQHELTVLRPRRSNRESPRQRRLSLPASAMADASVSDPN